MTLDQDQQNKKIAEGLLRRLKPEQRGLVETRRRYCKPCSQNKKLSILSVQCQACGCAGVSLIHGRCKLRKWPTERDHHGDPIKMPPPPAPEPDRPDWMFRTALPHTSHITPSNSRPRGGASGTLKDLFIYGFPGLYAGANTELHHQIILWRSMGLNVHLIPGDTGYRHEPLYPEMIERGVIVHQANEFDAILPGAPVLGFCNDRFLARIDEILLYSHNTVFVNCMTWLFEQEKMRHHEGKIAAFLYQNDEVRQKNAALLREINPDPGVHYLTFKPYFDTEAFPFIDAKQRSVACESKPFVIGRISRQDKDKFSKDTVHIWEAINTPGEKRGVMLGFGPDSERKLGGLSDSFREWVQTYTNQTELSQQDFYKQVDVIVQPMDTTENWPRIGLEAMASGCVLIVDNRGGWRQMIEHGVTGWLCDSPEDFVHYSTRMAYEPDKRVTMAAAAQRRLEGLAGHLVSRSRWQQVLEQHGAFVSEAVV